MSLRPWYAWLLRVRQPRYQASRSALSGLCLVRRRGGEESEAVSLASIWALAVSLASASSSLAGQLFFYCSSFDLDALTFVVGLAVHVERTPLVRVPGRDFSLKMCGGVCKGRSARWIVRPVSFASCRRSKIRSCLLGPGRTCCYTAEKSPRK